MAEFYGVQTGNAQATPTMIRVIRLCRKCGAKIFSDVPEGLCPRCVLKSALGNFPDAAVAGGVDPGRSAVSPRPEPASTPPATDEELTHRLVFLMVNEAARCVQEGVVGSPEDADYGMILGTGFAPFRGGPLRFAEHFGIKRTVEGLERLAGTEKKFTPCEILKKHARDGTKFYEE